MIPSTHATFMFLTKNKQGKNVFLFPRSVKDHKFSFLDLPVKTNSDVIINECRRKYGFSSTFISESIDNGIGKYTIYRSSKGERHYKIGIFSLKYCDINKISERFSKNCPDYYLFEVPCERLTAFVFDDNRNWINGYFNLLGSLSNHNKEFF